MNQQQKSGWLKVALVISAIGLASQGMIALAAGAADDTSPLHPRGETPSAAQSVTNPYISIFNPSALGPTRSADGTIGGTLRAAIKYSWD
ncbi:MAG: hypothetical protein Fur0025_06440 [Oscillatoriaceae cyanobacterium]